jgi:hypothetical protein
VSAPRQIPIALLDANVLYGQFVRDVLLWLANARLFYPQWMDPIQREWMENLAANRPDLAPEKIGRTQKLMERRFPDARVTGYRGIERSLEGVDPKDRHVAAAAVRAGASHLVTFNLRHFPLETLASYAITPIHPDAFILQLARSDRATVRSVLTDHRLGLRLPTLTPEEYRAAFVRAGLTRSAAVVVDAKGD